MGVGLQVEVGEVGVDQVVGGVEVGGECGEVFLLGVVGVYFGGVECEYFVLVWVGCCWQGCFDCWQQCLDGGFVGFLGEVQVYGIGFV